ncbi:MAG: cation:proton antiporter [Lentisphaerae bacterium]|nr:cation:proton antiporter [Lentisphaerota bacterium]
MDNIFTLMSVVVACSALLAWIASQSHQPILIAYFACGILLGPEGLGLVASVELLHDMSRLGVMLLLFLAGLVLHPDRLLTFFRKAAVITLAGSALNWMLIFALLRAWGYPQEDSAVAAAALMFSSTILVVKLLPTTTLHQKRMGSICIAVLIAQDIVAVVALLFLGPQPLSGAPGPLVWLALKAVLLIVLAVPGEQFLLRRMMRRADRYAEVLIMLCLGWCVGIAFLGALLGIPHEVGAFLAGVTLARGKIALILSEQLKPLRDFFLMFFFFALGAALEFGHLRDVWLPALAAALLICCTRPLWLRFLFRRLGETPPFATETAVRLGQASEFALVIAVAAFESGRMSAGVAHLVELATVLTMLISSYAVVLRYPTPIGVRPALLRD